MPKTKHDKLDSLKCKLHRYIVKEDVPKLLRTASKYSKHGWSKYLSKELDRKIDSGQQRYLHKFAKKGNAVMINSLLKLGASATVTDSKQNTVLHNAINYAISARDLAFFEDIVISLLGFYESDELEFKNSYGETANSLIEEYMRMINYDKNPKSEESEDSTDYENEFNDRLKTMAEMDDRSEIFADYVQDEHVDTYRLPSSTSAKGEGYSEWADRIYAEYQQKKKGKCKREHPAPSSTAKSSGSNEEVPNDFAFVNQHGLENIGVMSASQVLRTRLRLVKERTEYETICEHLLEKIANVHRPFLAFKDIPWPSKQIKTSKTDLNTEVVEEIFEMFVCEFEHEQKLKYLKRQQVFWHPDKFKQKFASSVIESDRENVFEMVIIISQIINSEITRIKSIES